MIWLYSLPSVVAPQAPGVLGPLAHRLAAFEDDRFEAHLGEDQPGKQAAGPGADDDGAGLQSGRCLGDVFVTGVGARTDVAVISQIFEQRRLVANIEVERVDQRDRRFFARIVAALENREIDQLAISDAESLAECGA